MAAPPDATRPGRTALLRPLFELPRFVRLFARLLRDRRVSIWPKLLFVGTIGYVLLPFDLIPDAIPVLGQLDDVALLVLSGNWFLQWSPAAVVEEHARALGLGGRV